MGGVDERKGDEGLGRIGNEEGGKVEGKRGRSEEKEE